MTINDVSGNVLGMAQADGRLDFDLKTDFFDALSDGNIERAADAFAADGELLFPGLRPVQGRPLVKRMLGIIRRRYEDISWQPSRDVIQSESWLVVSWRVHGTFRANAARYDNEGVSLVRLNANRQITMLSDYFKDTTAFQPSNTAAIARVEARHA